MVMAPDQESSGGQVVKPVDDICENDSSSTSPLKNGSLDEPVNGDIAKDAEDGDVDTIPDMELDSCNQIHLEWFQVQRVGAGLANLGNTCFLNTVIQCLTYCPPLANYLLQNDHSASCQAFEFCMMCELQKHIKEALQHSGDVIEPVHIYENLKLIAEHFQSGQQEDAHEFLRFVIENLWRASLYNYSSSEHRETTVINYIFGGYNRSQVICLRCKKRSNTYEHFMDFILDIKHNANTLEKALEHYVKPELLDKDNAYNCPRCNALVPAEKTYTIHRAPNVATIQLKRFDYNKSHGGKITKHVSYPEQLDLRPFMSEKTDIPLLYKLNAVLVHIGQNCNSGHYYCYIRNSNGYWYLMDDARVQRVGLSDVLNQQAYVLFYVRVPVSRVNKKSGVPYTNGTHLRNEGLNLSKTVSSDNHVDGSIRRRRMYMPFTKWASVKKNQWNDRRKPTQVTRHDQSIYNGPKMDNSHSLLSSPGEKASHSSRESSCSKRFASSRNDDFPFSHCMDNHQNSGFRSYNNGFHCDSFGNRPHVNGDIMPLNDKENDNELGNHRNNGISSGSFYSKPHQYKDYSRPHDNWQHSPYTNRRYLNENSRRGSHTYSNRNNFAQARDFKDRCYNLHSNTYSHFHRSASDSNLYLDSNGRNLKELNSGSHCGSGLKICHELNEKSWHECNGQQFQDLRNTYRNENGNSADHCSGSNGWMNRNGFRTSPRYSYEAKNGYNYVKERQTYRKFHEKSRSAEFASFSRPRYNPYYNARRTSHLQECF